MGRCDPPREGLDLEIQKRWMEFGCLDASRFGFRSDTYAGCVFRDIRPYHWRLCDMIEDVRVCQFLVAKALHDGSAADTNAIIRTIIQVQPDTWFGAQESVRQLVIIAIRAVNELEATWGVSVAASGKSQLARFLHEFRVADPSTAVAVDGDLCLRCAACNRTVPCALHVLAALPVKALPEGLRLNEWDASLLARAAWRGHNRVLKRATAPFVKRGMLQWWEEDVPEGVDRARLFSTRGHRLSARDVFRAAEAFGDNPEALLEELRASEPNMRSDVLRGELNSLLRVRDECDRVRGLWRLKEASRRILESTRLCMAAQPAPPQPTVRSGMWSR